MVLRGIPDGGGLEEGAHLGGTALQAAHVGGQAGLERGLVAWCAAARHRLLEIAVEEFVGIVLWRVGGQGEELDLIGMVVQPGSDPVCPMDWQIGPVTAKLCDLAIQGRSAFPASWMQITWPCQGKSGSLL